MAENRSAANAAPETPDLFDLSRRLMEHSGRMLTQTLRGENRAPSVGLGSQDPLGLREALPELITSIAREPTPFFALQTQLASDYARLCRYAARQSLGVDDEPVIEPEAGDARFKDPAWDEHVYFDTVKQAYLLAFNGWVDFVHTALHVDAETRKKLEFAVRQVGDALAPTNFVPTNPTALNATIESGGKNLLSGLDNLLDDLERSQGQWDIGTTDHDAFEVGGNLAITPGKVVFRNELLELIHYEPTTEKVARRPLLVIPPWMNKYYIMDLRPKNSLVRWLVEQGQPVFMVSWRNPDASMAEYCFEDYMLNGPLAALDAIEQATGEREVNAAGYCLGGILLSATMAYLAATGDDRIKSATYLTTMVDFDDVGEISLFIDEDSLEDLESRIKEQGLLDGRTVASTWRALRANDLIWSFHVNSYLLGISPRAFDILYWNADSTNMPAAVHTFLIRNMYVHNRLRDPGGITMNGVPIDMTKVKAPAYILSTSEDHIAPWRTTYATTGMFSGPVRFVLGASGHIAGVINPPDRGKYCYWTSRRSPKDPDEWLESATEHQGSWWPDWLRWLERHSGGKVEAYRPGAGELEPLCDAPGTYVKERIGGGG